MGYENQAQTSGTTKFTAGINKTGTGLVSGSLGGSSPSTYNPINTPLLISGVMTGSSGTNLVYLNGTSVSIAYAASGTFPSQTPTLQCIGLSSGQSFGYDFAECIVYGSTLTSTQIQQIEAYLAQKWGLTAQTTQGHLATRQTLYRSVKIAATNTPFYTQFTPLSIGGCQMWLDGADATTISQSANLVSQWTDKSGNGNHATQSTSGNRPTYSTNGLVFAGSHWLQTPITSFPTSESIFIVFKSSTGIADIFSGTTADSREVLLYTGPKLFLGKFGIDPSSTTPNAGVIPLNTTLLYDIQYTSSAVTFNVNGLITGLGTPYFTFSGTGTSWIGSSGYAPNNMYGTIYEFIYYNRSVNTTERQQIQSYLAQKWGLTMSLPTFAPNGITGCTLWYDAADASSITLNGSTVSKWNDKSGNANHLVQGTTSAQPTYGTYLSYPGLYFNGANTQTLSTTYIQLGTGGRTTFIVFYDVNTTPDIYGNPGLMYMGGTAAAGSGWRQQHIATLNALSIDAGASVKIMTTSPSVTSMRTKRCIGAWGAPTSATMASCYVYGNGTQFTIQDGNSGGLTQAINTDGSGTTVGSSTSVISEIIHYSTELTTPQRQQVEGYLAWKWGLQTNLPTSHPYYSSAPSNHINFIQPVGMPAIVTLATAQKVLAPLINTTLSGINYYNASQSYWGSYYYYYLQTLTKANASATSATIGGGVSGSGPGSAGYFGGVLAPNGNIYCIPCNSTTAAVINLSTNTLTASITGCPGNVAYYGGVLAPNGMIYCIPANATSVGMINPTTNIFSTPVIGTAPGGSAYFGGVLAPNGKIYCIPFGSTSIGVIDPVANTFTTFGTAPGGGAYQGGVLAPNGKIYCVPSTAGTIGVIDPTTNTFSTFGSVPSVGSGTYNGGALGPNGMIYLIPKNSSVIGMINPTTNTYSTFGTAPTSSVEFYYGAILAPNGFIYCLSQNGGAFGRIDPSTNTFTTISGSVQGGGGYYGGVLAPNGIIYVIPCNAGTVVTITISGLTQLPSLTYCLSPYTNKF